jgi:Lrp/AsnC family leucine-responsive transcriptional regulator
MMIFMPAPGDRIDRAILGTLQRDGRIANIDLAEAVSLSPSACLRRVKALEASGIIEGYRAEISRTKAGLGLTAFIGLKVDGHSRATSDQVERALMAIPAVVACHVVTGTDDFMVEVAAQDLADYEQVLLDEVLAIPAVLTAQSVFAIRTVLSRGPVPLTHWRLCFAGPAAGSNGFFTRAPRAK